MPVLWLWPRQGWVPWWGAWPTALGRGRFFAVRPGATRQGFGVVWGLLGMCLMGVSWGNAFRTEHAGEEEHTIHPSSAALQRDGD